MAQRKTPVRRVFSFCEILYAAGCCYLELEGGKSMSHDYIATPVRRSEVRLYREWRGRLPSCPDSPGGLIGIFTRAGHLVAVLILTESRDVKAFWFRMESTAAECEAIKKCGHSYVEYMREQREIGQLLQRWALN